MIISCGVNGCLVVIVCGSMIHTAIVMIPKNALVIPNGIAHHPFRSDFRNRPLTIKKQRPTNRSVIIISLFKLLA